ncbi:hypothetical protein OROHE_016802 [Orobanche hederae]
MDAESCFTVAFDCNYHQLRPFNCSRSIVALFAGAEEEITQQPSSSTLHQGRNDELSSCCCCGGTSVFMFITISPSFADQ